MALAVDASTPAMVNGGAVATLTTASFTPPAGSVLVVCTYFVNNTGVGPAVSGITDNLGSPLTYTQQVAQLSDKPDEVEIWTAPCPAGGAMTVTANWTVAANQNTALAVIVLTGADSVQNGAVAKTTSASGTPSLALTTTRDGSQVIGALLNHSSSVSPTVPAGQTVVFGSQTLNVAGSVGNRSWAQTTSTPTASSGTSVTINDTAPTAIDYIECLLEVLAAAPGPRTTLRRMPLSL